jgi:hypothetical protein
MVKRNEPKGQKMPRQLRIELRQEQVQELEQARDHHDKAYVREAAAAILKVAQGQSVRQVALNGLLKVRDPESVSAWIQRYQTKGISGLRVGQGRGRKAAFFPSQSCASPSADANNGRCKSPSAGC